jgi:ABC-2 type transport system ATP-binding protein
LAFGSNQVYYGDRMPAIRCQGLRKTYDNLVEAVRGVDLEVHQGECFGLLGPNGAGKTTTIEILEGLLEPTSGEIEVLGRRWGDHDEEIRQRLGISLQETKLSQKLSVEETLNLFGSFYRRRRDVEALMDEVGLREKRSSWVGKLSGGQKQRLAVASALVGDPELLFLDEPTTGLDPQSRRQLWDIVRGFKSRGRTVVLTTHYMEEAERLCDRVAVVDYGKVIALDSPQGLIARLGGDHVVEFSLDTMEGLAPETFSSLPAVRSAHFENGIGALTVTEVHVALPALLERLRTEGRELARLSTRHASLEDVFVSLTGRHLRDD